MTDSTALGILADFLPIETEDPQYMGVPVSYGKTETLIALVDRDDYALVSKYQWRYQPCGNFGCGSSTNGYAASNKMVDGKKKKVYMHRLIMGEPAGMHVDHKDDDGLHNWKKNLRVLDPKANVRPRYEVDPENKTSRYRGVSRHRKRWVARIKTDAGNCRIGSYDNELDAALAYDKEARAAFGDTAVLNFPGENI